ncbi:endoribonuclease Dicer homolog 2 [Tanacetum coccineum]
MWKSPSYDFVEEQVQYVPPELLGQCGSDSSKLYYFYSINLNKKFEYDISLQDIVLGVNTELELDNGRLLFDLDADRGSIVVSITYIGTSLLTSAQGHTNVLHISVSYGTNEQHKNSYTMSKPPLLDMVLTIFIECLYNLKCQSYARAYIDFKQPGDVTEFAEFLDRYVFVNEKGKLSPNEGIFGRSSLRLY